MTPTWLRKWREANPEWYSYASMMDRCYNKNCARYKDYGGRGVNVCVRWKGSFINFQSDMAPRPKGRSLDRINPDGNYEPGNCRWATTKLQGENRRSNGQLLLSL